MAVKIGVIAEEQNDVDIMYHLTCKLIPENAFAFKRFVAHGCGKLRRKCGAWAENLIAKGCTCIVILHDLDRCNECALREELERNLQGLDIKDHIVLIPVHDIEAWLLYDARAIRDTFRMPRTPRIPTAPEMIQSPKEHLRDLVWRTSRKRYVNTVHNARIASRIDLGKLKACPSFSPYPVFVAQFALS